MNIRTDLPDYINCASIELAAFVASLLGAGGRFLATNVQPAYLPSNPTRICLRVGSDEVSRARDEYNEGYPIVNNIQDARDLLVQQPIKVGEHTVIKRDTGVEIGCQFLPWAKVQQIAALDPQKKAS